MKLTIASLDDVSVPAVEAHYNPKEIDLGKQASWKDVPFARPGNAKEHFDLEYTGAPARTMSIELLFDGYEKGLSIEPIIATLTRLASPIDELADNAERRRPHICVAVWSHGELPKFQCVIEGLAVKYTMFARDGKPLRATCQLKLKEIRPRRTHRGVGAPAREHTRPKMENRGETLEAARSRG